MYFPCVTDNIYQYICVLKLKFLKFLWQKKACKTSRPLKDSLFQLAPLEGQLASFHKTYTFPGNVLLLQGCQFIRKMRKHVG